MHARMIGTVVCLCILSLVYSELLLYLGLLRRGSTAIDYSLFVYTNLVKISHTQIFVSQGIALSILCTIFYLRHHG